MNIEIRIAKYKKPDAIHTFTTPRIANSKILFFAPKWYKSIKPETYTDDKPMAAPIIPNNGVSQKEKIMLIVKDTLLVNINKLVSLMAANT